MKNYINPKRNGSKTPAAKSNACLKTFSDRHSYHTGQTKTCRR
ncbi:hypothetical protein [Neisseria sp. 83E34]|nr:hypothetical protein [Neisseria sp. 83E34]